MNKSTILFAGLILILIGFMGCSHQPTHKLAIKNVKIFDSRNKTVLENKTILINADTITSIIDASQKVYADETIEGSGRLVVPGFIDTHVHLRQMLDVGNGSSPKVINDSYRKKLAEKFLEYGTTTVLDMGQPESWMYTTIDWQKNPSPDYPNYFITGSAMISDLEWNNPAQHHVVIKDPEHAIKKVQQYDSIGSGYIKLYSKLEEPDMKVVVEAAKKRNINLYAHTDYNRVTMRQAMKMGVYNFEHFFTLTPSVLNHDVHWGSMDKKFGLNNIDHIDDFSSAMIFFFQYIKETPGIEVKLMDLFDKLAQEKATLSTAIHVLGAAAGETYFFSSFNHFPIRNSPELPDYTANQKQKLKKAFNTMMRYVKVAHDKGVELRIGTDNREAGKAMLSEFLLFYNVGFSVEDILQIATWNGAKAMKIEDTYGSVEIGKKADLVLFDKSPFDDHKNFLSQKTVIKGGKKYVPAVNMISTILQAIEDKGIDYGMKRIRDKASSFESYELVEIGYHLFHIGKINEGKAVLDFVENNFPELKDIYHERTFNEIGYEMLTREEPGKAIEFFKYNVELFPGSSNTHDSMGEAYMIIGNKELAIRSYEKSIEINPGNANGIAMLKKLRNKE